LKENQSVNGKKESPEVWKQIFENAIGYLSQEGRQYINSMKRYYKFVGKPSEESGKMTNGFYTHLGED
jgi:hypothetical protein